MIPGHKLTSVPLITDYSYEKPNTKLIDRSYGGITLQDASLGLDYQVWEIFYEESNVKIKGLTTGEVILLDTIPRITELSLAFDLNMNITFSYVSEDKAYLKYYNTTTQKLDVMDLGEIKSPRLVYDDLRVMQTASSDIVCAYINSSNYLCYRLLRDRYTIEYPLQEVPENARLIRVGMTEGLRLQFKMQLI